MTDTSNHEKYIELLLEAVALHFDSVDLKSRLNKCDVGYLKQWRDKNRFDLVHHCILENNIVALLLLLSRGFFKPPHEPSTWPYLHLVSCLGYKSFISTVVQELKYQNNPVALDWVAYHAHIEKKLQSRSPRLDKDDVGKKLTPVDVAAMFSHAACVRLLLDFWQVQSNNSRTRRRQSRQDQNVSSPSLYLSLACKVNSPLALRVLLKDSDVEDKKEALECAVRMSSPECVDIVLREGGLGDLRQSKVFQGMNLFHVLYSYSSCCTDPRQYEALVEITSILLLHGQDVNTLRPSRTFRLHSLLSHRGAGCSMEQRGPFLLAAILLLLKAKADPNVDEVLIENRLGDAEHSTAFGRGPHSSAAHCLISNLPLLKANAFEAGDSLITDAVDNYCYKSLELLLRHGADLGYVGKFKPYMDASLFPPNTYMRGTVLHLLLSMRSVAYINYPVLRFILHYGVNADTLGFHLLPGTSIKITYAINILPFILWSLHLVDSQGARDARSKPEITDKDFKLFVYVMRFMSLPALIFAFQEFTSVVKELKDHAEMENGMVPSLASELSEENATLMEMVKAYESTTHEPWSLQRCCSHVVWVACRHHMGNVYSLSIPGPLRKVILSFY